MNEAPAAGADVITTEEDAEGTAAVLSNDDDPNGDELSVTAQTAGTHGSVACETDGACTYTPEPDFNGTDSFTYTVADGRGGTANGTVDVVVTPVNDAPEPALDTTFVAAGGALVLAPAANDSPGPEDEAGQTVTVRSLPGPPSYGTADALPSGQVEYRPPERYSGPDWLEYEVCDDGTPSRCAVGSVRLKITLVAPTVETDPVANAGDAADDAAIWVNPIDPAESRVIGTDKGGTAETGGLAVYDLSGNEEQFLPGGRLNNVDLRPGFSLDGQSVALVAASDRTNESIVLFRMDPSTGKLVDLGSPIALGFEPYGICLYESAAGKHYAFVTKRDTEGYTEQWELRDAGDGRVTGIEVRSFFVGSLSEGCVADDDRAVLYLGEEDVGIWRYLAEPDGGSARTPVDSTGPGGHLAADVEGLALAPRPEGGGFLLASSQEAGEYLLYEREYEREAPNEYAGSFKVGDSAEIDGTSAMDGIEVTTAPLGPAFPQGLLVSHDGSNAGPAGPENQNFKLVPLELALGDAEVDVEARPTTCSRPYSAISPWNTPVSPNPVLDPESGLHMTAFTGSRLSSDPSQFTYPVYEVTDATPLVPVQISGWYSNVTDGGEKLTRQRDATLGVTVQLPIPASAEAAAGSDAQIILVDRATGDEWGVWRLERAADGAWSATNGYHYNTSWSGVPPYEEGDPSKPFLSRGAGVPYLTGLVRPCELARGRIEHALAFAYDFPTHEYVFPARKSDGNAWDGVEDELDSHPGDVPEGTRLQLDPSLSPADIAAWGCSGACLTIARALQEYGMYVIDNSARPKIMLEYEGTAKWSGVVNEATVRPIPFSEFRVLAAPAAP